jgi:MFS family permease
MTLTRSTSEFCHLGVVWCATGASLIFGKVPSEGRGAILIGGAMSFLGVALPFAAVLDAREWGWKLLLLVYALQGIGRATFEGTLKATFADFFPHEKEGAFANIIVQTGPSSSIGYFCT